MLERTTRSYFEDVIAEDFNYLQSNIVNSEKKQSSRTIRKRNSEPNQKRNDFLVEEHTMTRKTRTRRPRISALQSGYCAVCNIPYNSVEDHIQSKKHQKLIGEDANYIALNGSLNGFLQNSSIPFLNLNGIDAIGVHDTSLDEFSPTYKKRVMRRTRAVSVIFDRTMNPPPLSPADSDITGHHLRSRRNINYMTPPLEDDSLQEKPDLTVEEIEQENKDARELRLITRSLKKIETPQEEVWNSGRPKRACISKKRLSVDDRLANFKTYYKVEVVTPKLKINASKHQEATKRHKSQSPKREEEKDKGLIVKFKKLRNSELVQLNNEATNFLFPKKDDSSDEEEDDCNTTASSADSSSILELEDCKSSTPRLKNEDETSMDSTGKKKKRRTHAEAFILDNQKYYKFETPGSRLRYQGSYLPMVIKSPEHPPKIEDDIKFEEPKEKKIKCDAKVKLDNYKFAFEKVPINTGWYNAFKRLDNAEQSYPVFSNYFWESFVLPYQMRTIQPLDKKLCYNHYQELLTCLLNASSEANSRCSSPEASCSNSSVSMYDPQDEDSKLSASTISSIDDEEGKTQNGKTIQSVTITRCGRKSKAPFRGSRSASLSPNGSRGGKNPRKSPRQHASTLAILSGLIEQRKRRSKGRILGENIQNLSAIDEDEPLEKIEEEVLLEPPPPTPTPPPPPPPPPPPIITALRSPPASKQVSKQSPMKTKSPLKRGRPRIDYYNIARQIDEELDTALDADLENYELEITDDNTIDFNSSRITLTDILGLYEENNSKETEKSCRRFFNGQPGRKLGYRKKKANKTGWPKNKRPTTKKETNIKEKEGDVDSTIDTSVNNDTEEDEDEEDEPDEEEHPNPKSMKKDERPKQNTSVNNDSEKDEPEEEKQSGAKIIKKEERPKRNIVKQKQENNKNDKHSNSASLKYRVNKSDKKQLLSQLTNGELLQPYVCVQKLDSKKLGKKFIVTQKRTTKRQRQRRMPGSPKSPRMLRKPRGRWYRER